MALMDLVDDLVLALRHGEIVAYFQPQVQVHSGRIMAGEALARWNHPVHGVLGPDIFIPIAQEHGLIDALGIFMVDEAWRNAETWHAAGHRLQVSVNVSASQLRTETLSRHLARKLREKRLPEGTMIIEITETMEIEDIPSVASTLRDLRDLGLGISIDDFGSGYSTVERLDALPATELKIDISLVQDETTEAYGALIEIVEHAHELGIRVVAEGVETAEQSRRVELLRCHRAQGYLFGQPLPEREFIELIAQRSAADVRSRRGSPRQ